MDNPKYNSLAEQLKQSGILADANFETPPAPQAENVFLKGLSADAIKNEPKPVEMKSPEPIKPQEQKKTKAKKRINRYDLELLADENKETKSKPLSPLVILKRLIEIRRYSKADTAKISLKDRFFNGFFPKLYKIKIAKEVVQKLSELDIDTEALLDKSVPYGESEFRYDNLVKYLNYANQIQTKLNKKFY